MRIAIKILSLIILLACPAWAETPPEPEVDVLEGRLVSSIEEAYALAESNPDFQRPAEKTPLDLAQLDIVYFNGIPLGQVTGALTEWTGQNIVASTEAAKTEVNLYLRNVNGRLAVETLCRLNNLWHKDNGPVTRIITAEEYAQELLVRRDEKTREFQLQYASAKSVAEVIASLLGDRVEYLPPSVDTSYGHVGTDGSDPFENLGGEGRSSDVSRSISSSGSRSMGDNYSGSTYGQSSSRRNNQNESENTLNTGNIERLEQVMTGPSGEVSAAAVHQFLGTSAAATISVFMRNNCLLARSVDDKILEEIQQIVTSLDTPTQQVLLEVKILEVLLGDDFESFFDLSLTSGMNADGTPKNIINALDMSQASEATLAYSYLHKNIEMRMQLLERDSRLQSIATPLLLCANNAPASFFVGEEYPIITGYEAAIPPKLSEEGSVIVGTGSQPTPIVDLQNIGTKVKIVPSINSDGTVTLRVLVDVSLRKSNRASVFVIDRDGDPQEMPIDTLDTNNVASIVVAKNAQAIVMGGLIRETAQDSKERVPILGRIPVLGFFFRNESELLEKRETIIIIKPHIIGTPQNGAKITKQVLGPMSEHPYIREDRQNVLMHIPEREKLNTIPALPTSMLK